MTTTPGFDRWREDLVLSRIKAARFEVLSRILAAAATANEAPEETAKRLVGSVCMKVALSIAAAAIVGLIACGKASPVSPSVSGAQPIEQAQLNAIIWGTGPGGGTEGYDLVGVDTAPNGNPSPAGTDVTGKIKVAVTKSFARTFTMTYASVVSGPSSVVVPAFASGVNFTVHTSGSGTDATISGNNGGSTTTLTSHKSSNSIIWGT